MRARVASAPLLRPFGSGAPDSEGREGGVLTTYESGSPAESRPSNVLMDVSNAMVRVHKEHFGRGPTHARSSWAGPDTIVCLMENSLTPAERRLLELGENQRLREQRTFFQYASVPQFCGPVEEIVGRKVRAFISGIDVEANGLVTELFVLHPQGYEGPSRTTHSDV
jgi:uncharacterized protein YbcI